MGYWIQESNGYLQQIMVADSRNIWGTNKIDSAHLKDTIFKKIDEDGGWQIMPYLPNNEPLVYVQSISGSEDGVIMLTDLDNIVYRWYEYGLRWDFFPILTMRRISVGSSKYIWGLGMDNYPQEYFGELNFVSRKGNLTVPVTNLSVGKDGTVIVVDENGSLYRYQGNNNYTSLTFGNVQKIKVNSASSIYALTKDHTLHKYIGENIWHPIALNDKDGNPLGNPYVMDFDVANDETFYILLGQPNTQPNIYRYIP